MRVLITEFGDCSSTRTYIHNLHMLLGINTYRTTFWYLVYSLSTLDEPHYNSRHVA